MCTLLTTIFFFLSARAVPNNITWTEAPLGTADPVFFMLRAFVGYYNDRVITLGGRYKGGNDWSKYIEMTLNGTVLVDNSTLSVVGDSTDHSFVQNQNLLYMVRDYQTTLKIFDLDTKQITLDEAFDGVSEHNRCVTMHRNNILILGGNINQDGSGEVNDFWIYVNNTSWMKGTNLTTTRTRATCQVVHDKLYVIGGTIDGVNTDTAISLDVAVDYNNVWSAVNSSLRIARIRMKSVVFEHNIYVLGGYMGSGQTGQVDILQTSDDTFYDGGVMPVAKYFYQSLIVENVVYVYGGQPTSAPTQQNTYQFGTILTANPTAIPTINPTSNPSNPTRIPTSSPSNLTRNPTSNPTTNQTSSPSNPTGNPTSNLTLNPSSNSMQTPTIITTIVTDGEAKQTNSSGSDLLFIILAAAISVLLAISLFLCICLYKNRSKKRRKKLNSSTNETAMAQITTSAPSDNEHQTEGNNIDNGTGNDKMIQENVVNNDMEDMYINSDNLEEITTKGMTGDDMEDNNAKEERRDDMEDMYINNDHLEETTTKGMIDDAQGHNATESDDSEKLYNEAENVTTSKTVQLA